jgi:hypothetical protein
VENTVSLAFYDGPGPITGYYLTVYQNEAATDPTTIVFDHDFTTLTFITTNIDEASDWYLVPAGAAFTASTIATENFPILVKVNSSGFETHPIDAGLGSFYLAFNTGVGFSAPATPNRQIFGWAHFINHGDSIELVSSAISYDVPGIIVGTATAIPEPGGVALLLMGLAMISITRHRRRTE